MIMVLTAEKTVYSAFGMRLTSEIALPELTRSVELTEEIDVEVAVGDLSRVWNEEQTIYHSFYAVLDDQVLFYIPDTAIFSIQDGRKVIVSPIAGADEKKIRLYLLGTCMGVLLFQRKTFPLHGSAVVIEGKAYAFIGDSGAGKSTLAAAFLSKGYSLLSDDVIAVTLSDEGVPSVVPAYPQQKLWQESIDQLGMESSGYVPLYERDSKKYAIPVVAKFFTEPVPLGGVFELVKTEDDHWEIEPVEKLKRFPVLLYHTYRNHFISLLHLEQWHFATSASIARYVEMFQLRRPTVGFTAHYLASQILQLVSHKEECTNER